jgi:hypothetical protein
MKSLLTTPDIDLRIDVSDQPRSAFPNFTEVLFLMHHKFSSGFHVTSDVPPRAKKCSANKNGMKAMQGYTYPFILLRQGFTFQIKILHMSTSHCKEYRAVGRSRLRQWIRGEYIYAKTSLVASSPSSLALQCLPVDDPSITTMSKNQISPHTPVYPFSPYQKQSAE